MATKAQERAALEKIRKIVDGLGEESYIGHAMDGVFEDAEQNIENDFWNSYRDRYEYMNVQFEKAEDEIAKMSQEIKGLKEAAEAQKASADRAYEFVEKRGERITELNKQLEDAGCEIVKWIKDSNDKKQKIDALELENMKLKAKLYDMMVGA